MKINSYPPRCGQCDKTTGVLYTSEPPQVRCSITGEWHGLEDPCDARQRRTEDKAVKITGWVIAAGLLTAWLAFGTIAIIYCFKVFVLN